jgi:CheY-like chemotaxis protein
MARQSGGTARLKTVPGEGTTVKLYFRRAAMAPEMGSSDSSDASEDSSGPTASVLVVDDDSDVRGFIVEALEERGYRVRDSGDGQTALELFAAEQPDLVVLDFVMPSLSGAEVAQRMREQAPDQKILFVSGYSETEAIRGIAPNAPLLPKPFRADALMKAVQQALTSEALERSA